MDEKPLKDDPGPDTKDLRELCKAWGPIEAELVKTFLAAHGIGSLVRGRTVPFVYPFTVDGMAEFKIFVRDADLESARELMASMPAAVEDEKTEPEK
jgi:hypothetical protein